MHRNISRLNNDRKNGLNQQDHIIELIAENEEFEPIVIDLREQEVVIEGLGVGVIRKEGIH